MEHELVPLGLDDVDAIAALQSRWEEHWQVPFRSTVDEVRDDFEHPQFTPDLDTRGVWHEDRLVAYGMIHHTTSGSRLERAIVGGQVDPTMCGLGIGRRLLAWQVERAVERLRECDPALPWYVRAYEWEWIEPARRLYDRLGLRPVRWFEDMVRDLDIPLEVAVPEDIEIVDWASIDEEAGRRVTNESFADHWGSTPRDPEAWRRLLSTSDMRLDLSFAAVADGEVVGVCINGHFPQDIDSTGRIDGWIEILGVTRPYRRRGVAATLIARSLEAFRSAGFTHAMIGVDADSPTGASGLYRKLGFEPLLRSVAHELEVPHGGLRP
ncbi:MAG TPA: GNAT family N-acetyltransferase [Acidimicrobiia bacterium]|nr:GNAT family N-acetyltransferase [Acidimicrobiia bacterium]